MSTKLNALYPLSALAEQVKYPSSTFAKKVLYTVSLPSTEPLLIDQSSLYLLTYQTLLLSLVQQVVFIAPISLPLLYFYLNQY